MKGLSIPARPITSDWRPSDAVYQLLAQHSITREFVDDQLPEFILYWSERGAVQHSWGSKFLKHCIHEWRRREIEQAKVSREVLMSSDWMPSNKARSALLGLDINPAFINDCLEPFKLYWIERGEPSALWNSRFVQHVRFCWANRPAEPRRAWMDELTDRSWADN